MRWILATLSLGLLVACGDAATDDADATENDATETEATDADADDASADPMADARRADMIAECSADVAPEVPPSTDLDAFCGCAVDRMTPDGGGEREAMEACATEMGIAPENG